MLLAEDCFASQNAGFRAALRAITSLKLFAVVASIRGMIAYAQMVNPERGAILKAEFVALPQ